MSAIRNELEQFYKICFTLHVTYQIKKFIQANWQIFNTYIPNRVVLLKLLKRLFNRIKNKEEVLIVFHLPINGKPLGPGGKFFLSIISQNIFRITTTTKDVIMIAIMTLIRKTSVRTDFPERCCNDVFSSFGFYKKILNFH